MILNTFGRPLTAVVIRGILGIGPGEQSGQEVALSRPSSRGNRAISREPGSRE